MHMSAKGPVSVAPKPVASSSPPGTISSATRVSRSQTGWLMPAPAYIIIDRREKKVRRSWSSVSIASSSICQPTGTLKYQVGAISRRLRIVSPMPEGEGLPASM